MKDKREFFLTITKPPYNFIRADPDEYFAYRIIKFANTSELFARGRPSLNTYDKFLMSIQIDIPVIRNVHNDLKNVQIFGYKTASYVLYNEHSTIDIDRFVLYFSTIYKKIEISIEPFFDIYNFYEACNKDTLQERIVTTWDYGYKKYKEQLNEEQFDYMFHPSVEQQVINIKRSNPKLFDLSFRDMVNII